MGAFPCSWGGFLELTGGALVGSVAGLSKRRVAVSTSSSLLQVPLLKPLALDPGYVPAALANRRYREAVRASGKGVRLGVALERENGLGVSRGSGRAAAGERARRGHAAVCGAPPEVLVVVARGGWRLHLQGPAPLVAAMREAFRGRGCARV